MCNSARYFNTSPSVLHTRASLPLLQKQSARIRALRLRRTMSHAKRGPYSHCAMPRSAAQSSRTGKSSKRGRGDMAAFSSEPRLHASFMEALAAALATDSMLPKRITALTWPTAHITLDRSLITGQSTDNEPLTRVLTAAVATSGFDATTADAEHLACVLRLADAGTADTVADAIR